MPSLIERDVALAFLPMLAEQDAAARVQASVDRTSAERTAQLRYRAHFSEMTLGGAADRLGDLHPTAGRWLRSAGAAARRALKPASRLDGKPGRIDFQSQRSLYDSGRSWKLFAPGCVYHGQPGDWDFERRGDDLDEDDPFWLLAVIAATTEAVEHGADRVVGTDCTRYRAIADFTRAASATSLQLSSPLLLESDQLDLGQLQVDVWLDSERRICRADFHGPRDLNFGVASVTRMELSEFGTPERIELPDRAEVTIPE